MALALTTAVSILVSPEGEALNLFNIPAESAAIFGAFFITLVPFYHGASIYLLQAHRKPLATKKRGDALVDFFAFALEAVIFYAMAKSTTDLEGFIIWFGALLLLDTVWVVFTYFKSQTEREQAPKWWLVLNGGMLLVLILLWGFASTGGTQVYLLLFAVAVIRTAIDYWKCYDHYFPSQKKTILDCKK